MGAVPEGTLVAPIICTSMRCLLLVGYPPTAMRTFQKLSWNIVQGVIEEDSVVVELR